MVDARDLKSLGLRSVRVQVSFWVPRLNQGFTNNFRIVCRPFFYVIFWSCPTPVPPFSSKNPLHIAATVLTAALFSCVQRRFLTFIYLFLINKSKRVSMTPLIDPSKRGVGRVQYLSLKIDVEKHLFAGHTRIAVYNHFRKNGMITISYSRFCYYVSHYSSNCLQKNQDSTPSPILSAASLPANTNSPVQLEQGQKFAHEKNLSDENIKDLT